MDLTNATTLASIMTIAAQLVPTQSDAATVAALIQGLTAEQISAVALAVANLNGAVAASTDAQSAEKGSYYAQTEVRNLSLCSVGKHIYLAQPGFSFPPLLPISLQCSDPFTLQCQLHKLFQDVHFS